jgi:YHS domain-containing protein
MRIRSVLAGATVAGLLAVTLYAADVKLEGVKCLMNPKADAKAEASADYKGAKVYFCCGNCLKKFTDKPEEKAARANHQLVATKQATQEKCPLTGRALNDEQTVKVAGVDVTLCCPGCKGKVTKAEGDEQLELVFSDKAFEKGFKLPKKEKE